MDNSEEQDHRIDLPHKPNFEKLREAFINLLSSVDPTIDWSKVHWDHQTGEGFGSCTSDDSETKQKLKAAYVTLNTGQSDER
ncbi:hypothetical protein LX87_03545 [Larkinella arboricola]|uniref:Uncharacterized protein n=1 Tax=Larkinella arboricola TaxID=643671 RepID=A0A327WUR2_LARAB|nr:hypothetical protein [Larkinella arboricola]RAJ95797.1 hypothetical protein LX87_03545 [Larkinella arboricola]